MCNRLCVCVVVVVECIPVYLLVLPVVFFVFGVRCVCNFVIIKNHNNTSFLVI